MTERDDEPHREQSLSDERTERDWPRLYPFTNRLRLPRGADDDADRRTRDALIRGFAAHVGAWVSVVALVLLVLALRACVAD